MFHLIATISPKYTCSVCVGLALVSGSLTNSVADEPKDGGVEISLKLIPSSPTPKLATESGTAEQPKSENADEPATSKQTEAKKVEPGKTSLKLLPQEGLDKTTADKPKIEMAKGTGAVEVKVLELPENQAAKIKNSEKNDIVRQLKISSSSENDRVTENQNGTRVIDIAASKAGQNLPGKKATLRDGDPGDPGDAEVGPGPLQLGDLPLDDDTQPYDAPAAQADENSEQASTEGSKPNTEKNSTLQDESSRLRDARITDVLEYYRKHPENIVRRGPWALMHTILPFGAEAEVIAGTRKVNTIGWLTHNGIAGKQRLFQPTTKGFRTNVGPGVQGHEGQFLAVLAQSHISQKSPVRIGNRNYTVADLVKNEMATCREKTELTFKLIAFAHYLPPNQTWRDNRGRSWSIEKLVAEELAQPINGEACGGTHRLMGLSCAVVRRRQAGLPMTGHFERAETFLNDYVDYTLSLQNSDGSFSTEWFERRADEPNIDRKIQTTGHILEWLVYFLPEEQLRTPAIEKAVDFLLINIGRNPARDWPIGPRGHSLRALVLYQNRIYGSKSSTTDTKLASPPRQAVGR